MRGQERSVGCFGLVPITGLLLEEAEEEGVAQGLGVLLKAFLEAGDARSEIGLFIEAGDAVVRHKPVRLLFDGGHEGFDGFLVLVLPCVDPAQQFMEKGRVFGRFQEFLAMLERLVDFPAVQVDEDHGLMEAGLLGGDFHALGELLHGLALLVFHEVDPSGLVISDRPAFLGVEQAVVDLDGLVHALHVHQSVPVQGNVGDVRWIAAVELFDFGQGLFEILVAHVVMEEELADFGEPGVFRECLLQGFLGSEPVPIGHECAGEEDVRLDDFRFGVHHRTQGDDRLFGLPLLQEDAALKEECLQVLGIAFKGGLQLFHGLVGILFSQVQLGQFDSGVHGLGMFVVQADGFQEHGFGHFGRRVQGIEVGKGQSEGVARLDVLNAGAQDIHGLLGGIAF